MQLLSSQHSLSRKSDILILDRGWPVPIVDVNKYHVKSRAIGKTRVLSSQDLQGPNAWHFLQKANSCLIAKMNQGLISHKQCLFPSLCTRGPGGWVAHHEMVAMFDEDLLTVYRLGG